MIYHWSALLFVDVLLFGYGTLFVRKTTRLADKSNDVENLGRFLSSSNQFLKNHQSGCLDGRI